MRRRKPDTADAFPFYFVGTCADLLRFHLCVVTVVRTGGSEDPPLPDVGLAFARSKTSRQPFRLFP